MDPTSHIYHYIIQFCGCPSERKTYINTLYNNSGDIRPLRTRAYQPTSTCLTSTCPQTKMNDRLVSLKMFYVVSLLSLPTFVDFLDRSYRYKSVAALIPHDARVAAIPCTGRKFILNRTITGSRGTSSMQ